MVYAAHSRGAAVVDATPAVTAIHQNHDYGHVRDGEEGSWKGPEERRNKALAGGRWCNFNVDNASWLLTRRLVLPAVSPRYVRRRLAVLSVWLVEDPRVRARLGRLYGPLSRLRKIFRAIVGTMARGRREEENVS